MALIRAVAYCGTRNLYDHMLTAAKSLLKYNKIDKIYFIIEDDWFPVDLPEIFECINVKDQTFFTENSPNYNSKWTYMVLIRAALTKILPQDLSQVLSLDVDTLVTDNIMELWDIDLQDYYIAGCIEPKKCTGSFIYINFGVCMLNLAKLRNDKKDDDIIHMLNTHYYFANEQDCFNDLCQGHILLLPSDYNVCNFTPPQYKDSKKILHFAAEPISEWSKKDIVLQYKKLPLKN